MCTKPNRYFYHVRNCWRWFASFILLLILFFPIIAWAQDDASTPQSPPVDSTMSFDLSLAPPVPGFVVLGIEPTSVERPGTVTDLAVTILNETENLTVLPENFALEFAPYWLFFGENISYEDYASSKIGSALLQTLSLSVATSSRSQTPSNSLTTSLALGIRSSILRGNIDETFNNRIEALNSLFEELGKLNDRVLAEAKRRIEQDSTIQSLIEIFPGADEAARSLIEVQISQREAQIKQQVEAEIREQHAHDLKNIKEIISGLRLRRIGWKLDVAGGAVYDFPQRVFDNGQLSRWGAWLTGGYEGRKLSVLAVLRYLSSSIDSDQSSVDVGGRVIFDDFEQFSLSAEAVYRGFPGSSTTDDQRRFAILIDYAIAKNTSISVTLGRDFSGSLITSVSFLQGFGSNRPVLSIGD
ncbi:MAG: hypothetical protein ACE5JP_02435 [Candidatus Bipolaricaulia bacterium]